MSIPGGRDLSETFQDFLNACAKFLFWAGLVLTVGSAGLLMLTVFMAGGDSAKTANADAVRNVGYLQQALLPGTFAVAVGASVLFWGEEMLGALLLIGAGVLYFSPLYFPLIVNSISSEGAQKALAALQTSGTLLGIVAVMVLVIDVSIRVRQRAKVGVKADQLKLGKGLQEESDKQNIFMGKCWQLPYCRKFVRERCPIYHAKRTCWKEQTGCMCDEQVIRNAMENKPIPKDALLAAAMIPRNQRLTPSQKFERCKSCVIYNEHQRHKYKAALPVTIVCFIGSYALFRGPLLDATRAMMDRVNQVLFGLSFGKMGQSAVPSIFVELLLIVFFVIGLTYVLKMLDLVIFKLKL